MPNLTDQQLESFEKCLSVWTPTRKNKGVCKKAWLKYVVPAVDKGETTYDEIFERILAWNRYFKAANTERKYIKLFETWIRNEGWLDDIPSVSEANRVELKKDRFFKAQEVNKSSPEIARKYLDQIKKML